MSSSSDYAPVKIPGNFGYGTMSLTWTPKPPPFEQAIDSLNFVISHPEFGSKLINGGEFYGFEDKYLNLKLLKEFVDSNDPEVNKQLVISIKGGIDVNKLVPDGSKESIQKSIENIISYFPKDPKKRPKLLFEIARVDPKTPYEETIGYIAEFVKQGKIDGISLSEVGVNSIIKASNVFPISCVEIELSLLCQDSISNDVLEELSKRQIPIIAYSPLCRGLLTDHTVENADTFLQNLDPKDIRHHIDKFSTENYANNIKLVKKLYEYAHEVKKTSLESLALSWILAISENKEFKGIKNVTKILPIPSGSTKQKIKNNFSKLIELSDDDLNEIDKICQSYEIKGYRYNKFVEHLNFA